MSPVEAELIMGFLLGSLEHKPIHDEIVRQIRAGELSFDYVQRLHTAIGEVLQQARGSPH